MDDTITFTNPCLSCGACCVFFRVSFYWGETDDNKEGGVPVDLTMPVAPFRRAMRQADGEGKPCIALNGTLGRKVNCTIYERRPSVCRDFIPSWFNGKHHPRCDKARKIIGLDPLTPDSWTPLRTA